MALATCRTPRCRLGGESTHAALSGHRGLPTASLFTDLDQMQLGDQFYIKILNETLAYEVDQILDSAAIPNGCAGH